MSGTVGELLDELAGFPADTPVYIDDLLDERPEAPAVVRKTNPDGSTRCLLLRSMGRIAIELGIKGDEQ